MRKMLTKMWIALALGATLIAGSAATVAAIGNMNGDCLQDQTQLKDGSCQDTTDDLSDDMADVCDSCNDYLYDWDFLYGEPGPHQSACGE
jgi:hypothetical protein